jgi:hypothetical protein
MPAAALAALLALPLSACTTAVQDPPPTHSASPSPLFTSDADALKAATDAYAAYLKMSDTISHDGGAHPERINPYAIGQARNLVAKSAKQFADAKAHADGETSFSAVSIQETSPRGVVIYACEDVSGVDILSTNGESLVAPDRETRYPVQVSAVFSGSSKLLVSNESTISVHRICG